MAITGADVEFWRLMGERKPIRHSPKVVEIGQANWYGDVPPPEGCDISTDEGRFAAADRFWRDMLGAFHMRCAIDLHGTGDDWVYPFDLNEPIDDEYFLGGFDLLVNTGTAEHVFNQHQFWKNCHDITAPGGTMVHGLPWVGWLNHGLYSYHPTFVFDLAAANGYEVLLMCITEIQPTRVVEVNVAETQPVEVYYDRDTMIQVALKKVNNAPFKVPFQGRYASGKEKAKSC